MDDTMRCHLDPDIRPNLLHRHPGWRPVFGQTGPAQGHLRKQGVGPGDLFVFFGWFRCAELCGGRLRYVGPSSGFHAIYAYLSVGYTVAEPGLLADWMDRHPHSHPIRSGKSSNDMIYVAAERLSTSEETAGSGNLRFSEQLVLTKAGERVSRWSLPTEFRRVDLTYHNSSSWRDGYFQSTSPGQEFVFQESETVSRWATELVSMNHE